jgi:hypothetical protein
VGVFGGGDLRDRTPLESLVKKRRGERAVEFADTREMCFDQKSSFGFALFGLLVSMWIYTRTENVKLAGGVFFFFTMELLQGFQYFVIADNLHDKLCDSTINQVLTMLGFLHICMQPYFCHVINASLTRSERYLQQYAHAHAYAPPPPN